MTSAFQPSGVRDKDPHPCLPEIATALQRSEDIGCLWNWPRCGLPSKVHLRSEASSLIADIRDWWSSDHLFFCKHSGEIEAIENGLQQLLQAGLICQELQHCEQNREDAAALLAGSCLNNEATRQCILEILASYASHHTTRLTDALAAWEADELEIQSTPEADDTYDAQEVNFSKSVTELAAQIQEETAKHDRYMRTVEKSLELDAVDRARPAANFVTRTQQNKDNRQRTGTIHPPKVEETPQPAPDLSFVNDVTLPDVAPRIVPNKKTRKAKKDVRVRARPTNMALAMDVASAPAPQPSAKTVSTLR